MSTRRPVSWFLTERGRKFSFFIMTSTGIALSSARNSKPVEFSTELTSRFEKCLELLELPAVHRKLIQPFSVYGYDLFHAGTTSSKFGAAVGIPVNFTYKSFEDLEKDNIQVNQKPVNWETEVGNKLANAIIIPEKVQEFAICREILMTRNNKVVFDSCYPFISIFFVYNFCQYLNQKLNLYIAHPSVRGTMYSIVGLFGLGTYFLMKDLTEVYYETRVDKKLCELGTDFIESGVTFYEKLLQRNQALRELMGKEGERKYSKMGNENYGLRQPHIALVHRKQFFEQKLKQSSDSEKLDTGDEII